MKKKLLTSLLFFMVTMATYAQVSLTGEIRPRAEMYNGTNSALSTDDSTPTIATQQRTRLYFTYTSPEGVSFKFSPQYINWWGGSAQTNGGALSVFEAWAAYDVSDKFNFKFGRQMLSYGDQRFFGGLGWAAPGRSFDAAVGKFKLGKAKLDVGITYNQVGLTNNHVINIVDNHKSLQYAWLDAPLGEGGSKLSAMLANVYQTTSDPYTTIGVMPTIKAGAIKFDISAYYQFGTFAGTDISAYLLSASATVKAGSLPLTIGADIVSGDDESTPEMEGWKQQFGTNHKFYGFMDFFYVGEQPSMGVNDFYIKTKFKTGEKSSLLAHLHVLTANTEFTDEIGGTTDTASGYLGTELDLVYALTIAPEFKLNLGYSHLFANDSFELYKPGDAGTMNNWLWLQLTVTPKFL